MITKKFYFPLLCRFVENGCWEEQEVSNSYIYEIETEIAEDLEKYQNFGSEKMHEFFDENEDVSNKLLSTVWSFEKIEGEYYGCVTVQLSAEIDAKGVSDLKDWISGQNSDGLGEGFEQRDFDVEDGSLFISFWNSTDDYFIYDEEEMENYLNPSPIKNITTDDLRKMSNKEGLILQGCGGDLKEWLDGINKMLTEEEILLNGTKFSNIYCFKNGELTNLLFPFENVKLNIGKLAIWRLYTHDQFAAKWLSDYVPNNLGGFITEEREKPSCALIGEDGNIFNLMGIASKTLRKHGMAEEAQEMCTRIRASDNYDKALGIIMEYVNVTSIDDVDETEGFEQSM